MLKAIFTTHLHHKSKAVTTSWITCSCFVISKISAQPFSQKFYLRVQKVAEGDGDVYIYILLGITHKIGQSLLFASCQNPP